MIRAPSFEVESNCLLLSHPPMVRTTQGPDSTAINNSPLTNRSVWIRLCLLSVRGSFFDQSCDFLRHRDVNSMTGARDFDLMALGSLGIPPLQVGIDGSIFRRY